MITAAADQPLLQTDHLFILYQPTSNEYFPIPALARPSGIIPGLG